MLRRSFLLYSFAEGERRYTYVGESPMNHTGGLPFYGNLYAGRAVEAVTATSHTYQNYQGAFNTEKKETLWSDPAVRARLDQCPYFALCDQVVFHNMDPAFLDPGLLTDEEHQLLLLFSRAYYEKWKTIHEAPMLVNPTIRLKYGSTTLLNEISNLVGIDNETSVVLQKEFLVDDASLIAMQPECWTTAYLDPFNMDHWSGRVLEFAGVPRRTREKIFLLLDQMRRLKIVRRDVGGTTPETIIIPFRLGVTLYDLYVYLNLPPYSGQLKVYDYVDLVGTPRVLTLSSEEMYFDFLLSVFNKADIRNATLSDLADDTDHTTRYSITVEPYTTAERRIGKWF